MAVSTSMSIVPEMLQVGNGYVKKDPDFLRVCMLVSDFTFEGSIPDAERMDGEDYLARGFEVPVFFSCEENGPLRKQEVYLTRT
jgi:hypothetical protein